MDDILSGLLDVNPEKRDFHRAHGGDWHTAMRAYNRLEEARFAELLAGARVRYPRVRYLSAASPASGFTLTIVSHLDDPNDVIGHVFAVFETPWGWTEAFGFFPEVGTASSDQLNGVPGSVVFDYKHYSDWKAGKYLHVSRTFSLNVDQFQTALAEAYRQMLSPPDYRITATSKVPSHNLRETAISPNPTLAVDPVSMCGTFAASLARAAGIDLGVSGLGARPRALFKRWGGGHLLDQSQNLRNSP